MDGWMDGDITGFSFLLLSHEPGRRLYYLDDTDDDGTIVFSTRYS